jgi:hypothetical protein
MSFLRHKEIYRSDVSPATAGSGNSWSPPQPSSAAMSFQSAIHPVWLVSRTGVVPDRIAKRNQSHRSVPKTPTAAMFMLERSPGISLQHSRVVRRKIARKLGSTESLGHWKRSNARRGQSEPESQNDFSNGT